MATALTAMIPATGRVVVVDGLGLDGRGLDGLGLDELGLAGAVGTVLNLPRTAIVGQIAFMEQA